MQDDDPVLDAGDRDPHARPMGYPFDRPVADGIAATLYTMPSVAARSFTIRWMSPDPRQRVGRLERRARPSRLRHTASRHRNTVHTYDPTHRDGGPADPRTIAPDDHMTTTGHRALIRCWPEAGCLALSAARWLCHPPPREESNVGSAAVRRSEAQPGGVADGRERIGYPAQRLLATGCGPVG